jgi:transcription-repair coupling factor (superfamily II helicase)
VLTCDGVCRPAQPFLTVLLKRLLPQRPVVVVTEGLRTQESFHQDIETWLRLVPEQAASSSASAALSQPLGSPDSLRHLPVSDESPRGTPSLQAKCHATDAPPSPLRTPPPLFYPGWEVLPHENKLPHVDVLSERLETLEALLMDLTRAGASPPVIVTSVVALLQPTFPAARLAECTRIVRRGDRIDPLGLIEWLEDQSYEPEDQVNQKGEIALRGGILDVFPLTSPWPVRLEFFGDELESLRHFDPLTQRSREAILAVTIPPAGELGILRRSAGLAPARDSDTRAASDDSIPQPSTLNSQRALATLLDYLPRETIFLLCEPDLLDENAELYARQTFEHESLYVPWESFREAANAKGVTWLALVESGEPFDLSFSDPADVLNPAVAAEPPLTPSELPADNSAQPVGSSLASPSTFCTPQFESLDAFRPLGERAPEPPIAEAQRREFFAQLHRWLRQGYAVHVFCNNDGERQRFTEIWDEYGFSKGGQASGLPGPAPDHRPSGNSPQELPSPRSGKTIPAGRGALTAPPGQLAEDSEPHLRLSDGRDACPTLHLGSLTRGFICDEGKLVVVTDAEIFGRYKVQRPRRLKSQHAQTTRSALDIDFTDLEEGDYVVHVQHGIGRYLGLKVLPATSGRKPTAHQSQPAEVGQECLVIEYAPSDPAQPPPKLYVPVTEAHLVSKYVGTGKGHPPLNALGGTRWARTKASAVRAVRDLTGELLSIQAARESQPGHAFAVDTPWQREFEGAFLYEETPDQWRAIGETKRDMETLRPMDRLICGDVGYGKTEVALRAAFKAVLGGRQVAVLVPTTVLAQQHFNTFRERMSDYPVRIELLSRFRTRREQATVVRGLASGAVDIVIGTHRLVQDDVIFKELGLVVIDEEQRFGVLQKEKFKQLRKLVDVLTLSATPIPRTLYLALTGARDMSTIQTPPQDRLPVETIVTPYDERVIRDAIQRELNRQGQVFFLHNRVMTIDAVAQRLGALVPNARIVVGHGQMDSGELEEVMTRFVNGQADVLLSTTIIESGLDIPNANTIIIDRADRFGLSELYQLRGRVGRYKHQAYAYLLLPRHAGLLADARKRISAIRQYSSLGSGFKIAMRDLEIRGAGNLLGPEQSGHITAVGFELYCQLLKQSVSALKGEKVQPRVEVQLRLDFLALQPEQEMEIRSPKSAARNQEPESEVHVPREVAAYASDPGPSQLSTLNSQIAPAPAYLPLNYITESHHRIEIYRKLAQAMDQSALEQLRQEIRDRFGPLPAAVDLLLLVAETKLVASARGVTVVETKDDKLMLTRNHDYITLAGKFPRLTKKQPKARVNEIKRLLGTL